MMKIRQYRYFDPEAEVKFNPEEIVIEGLNKINITLGYLEKNDGSILDSYANTLTTLFEKDIDDFDPSAELVNQEQFPNLQEFPRLLDLVVKSILIQLQMDPESNIREEHTTRLIDEMQARFHVNFLRVKAFAELMGREKGIQYWKAMVTGIFKEKMANSDQEIFPAIAEKFDPEELDNWGKIGSQRFSAVIYDEYKAFLKVDRCIVHEAFKLFNDPELSYLAYCYMGSIEDKYNTNTRRRITPVTLYNNDYCLEFFYNHNFHPDAQPPTLKEIEKITKPS